MLGNKSPNAAHLGLSAEHALHRHSSNYFSHLSHQKYLTPQHNSNVHATPAQQHMQQQQAPSLTFTAHLAPRSQSPKIDRCKSLSTTAMPARGFRNMVAVRYEELHFRKTTARTSIDVQPVLNYNDQECLTFTDCKGTDKSSSLSTVYCTR